MSKLMQMHCVISGHRTHTRQALPELQNPRIPHQFGSEWLRDTHQWNREKSCQRTKDSDWSMPSDIDVVYHRALESCLKPSAIPVILKERWQMYVFSCWWGSCKAVSKMQPWIIVAIMGFVTRPQWPQMTRKWWVSQWKESRQHPLSRAQPEVLWKAISSTKYILCVPLERRSYWTLTFEGVNVRSYWPFCSQSQENHLNHLVHPSTTLMISFCDGFNPYAATSEAS